MTGFRRTDGGRAAAGYRGEARDCVTRAVAIAADRPYREVYERLAAGHAAQRSSTGAVRVTACGRRTAREGIDTRRRWFRDYMAELGFEWTPTMAVGAGTTVHLTAAELPPGRLVVRVSKHCVAVIDGVVHDTHDPRRGGTRCVYGYWRRP